jgi:MoaA/NifB/PqqE/SkfB family radical SAM enzyme
MNTAHNRKTGDIATFSSRISVYDYKMIKLEYSAACNAHCQFCTMFYHVNKPKDLLSLENARLFFEINTDWLIKNSYYIEPFFNGESLLNPHFFEISDMLLHYGCCLGDLDTNLGVPIDIERLAMLPFRIVTVNIGGTTEAVHDKVMGTPLNLVISNLKRLAQAVGRKFEIFVKMNPVADNIHQIDTLDSFVSALGDTIGWKAQQTGIPVPNDLSEDQIESVYNRIYSNDGDDYFRFIKETDGSIKSKNSRCIYTLPCISANGQVTICAHDQIRHLNLGNAFSTSLQEIMNSDIYKNTLVLASTRNLFFCRGCN